jgi:hypothetical protein
MLGAHVAIKKMAQFKVEIWSNQLLGYLDIKLPEADLQLQALCKLVILNTMHGLTYPSLHSQAFSST